MDNRNYTHILTALPCEAKPLIAHYQLKRCMAIEPFTTYEKDNVTLTVTGIGKVSMAASVAFIHQLVGGIPNSVWLNIGIAGHQSHPVGSAFIAHKITDADTGRCWYPPQPFNTPCESEEINTVSIPLVDYPETCLYDMEASAFHEIAMRFSTGELVQCLKIVSDNTANPAEKITPQHASTIVEANLQTINALLHKQQRLAETINPDQPEWYSMACEIWRFTHSEKIQLKDISRYWQVVSPDDPPELEQLPKNHSGKQILGWLKVEIATRKMNLSFR